MDTLYLLRVWCEDAAPEVVLINKWRPRSEYVTYVMCRLLSKITVQHNMRGLYVDVVGI